MSEDIQTVMRNLRQPFDPSQIHWRVGSTKGDKSEGIALAYLDARDVMERLDDAVGPENWQCRYPHANGKTVCDIGIRINGEWIWKSNGAGDTDIEGDKGALSDAFKRAAVLWGVGRYLYDLKNTWVKLEQKGRSTVIARAEYGKLERALADLSGQPPRSAQSLKLSDKDGKDAWQKIVDDLEKDFGDTNTLLRLNELEKEYGKKVTEDRWPEQWKRLLRNKFDEKQREIMNKIEAEEAA